MKRKKMISPFLFLWGASSLFFSGCATEESPVTANVVATFRLKSTTAMDGKITIDEAFLKLDRIEGVGALHNGNQTHVTHHIPADDPPYTLRSADSSTVTLRLPPGVYDQLDFNLYLFQDTYQLVMDENPAPPAPAEHPDGGQPAEQEDHKRDEAGDAQHGDEDDGGGSGEDNDDHDKGSHGDPDDDEDSDHHHGDEGDDHKNDGHHHDGHDQGGPGHDKHEGKGKDHKGHGHHDRVSQIADAGQVNLDDFFHNARPGILVVGTYKNNGKTLKLIFVASGIGKLSVHAKQDDSFGIVLAGPATAEIVFDPEQWFSTVSSAEIESVPTQVYQGQNILFIHPDDHPDLFQKLRPRLEESADMNFHSANF